MAKKQKQTFLGSLLSVGIGFLGFLLIFLLLFVIMPAYQDTHGFALLNDVAHYAAAVPEHPPLGNTNIVRPDYKAYHRGRINGFFKGKLLSIYAMLGMGDGFGWSPAYFERLLEDSNIRLGKDKLEKSFLYKMAAQPGDRIIVWGDLQGAYHSLVRGLLHLYKMGVLGDDLKIKDPKVTFVFMGDAISRSAFGMEILSLIMCLLQRNPEQVIYLRGNHEDKKYWHAFGLKDQLKVRLGPEKAKKTVKDIDTFFKQLPLALYFAIPGEKDDFVRLSHIGWQRSKKLKEERYVAFLKAPQKERIDGHKIDKSVNASEKVSVSAIIRSEKKRHTFQAMDGIRLLPTERGATSWTLLSSPTTVSQKGLKFHHDAFVIISVAEKKDDWTITLYNQDAIKPAGFVTRDYEFFTGQEKGA